MLVKSCERIESGLPLSLRWQMYFNIAIDFGIGLLPVVGDLADVYFRANMRNAMILGNYLHKGSTDSEMQGSHRLGG